MGRTRPWVWPSFVFREPALRGPFAHFPMRSSLLIDVKAPHTSAGSDPHGMERWEESLLVQLALAVGGLRVFALAAIVLGASAARESERGAGRTPISPYDRDRFRSSSLAAGPASPCWVAQRLEENRKACGGKRVKRYPAIGTPDGFVNSPPGEIPDKRPFREARDGLLHAEGRRLAALLDSPSVLTAFSGCPYSLFRRAQR
jgi:hypothetical protein